ncbi:hypothetical protein WMF39_36320 [Sorangium sp. So ce1504]|uniref:hypothetical protein n=1 Tax=Sorangium sp. So ce1504 TaxID=3133337 RepID=UPI003F5DBE84
MPEDEQRTSAAVLGNAESRVPGAFERGNSKGRARLAITPSSRCHHKDLRNVLLSAAEALITFRAGLSWRSSAVKRPHASISFTLLDNRQILSSDARFRGSTCGRRVAPTDCMRGMSTHTKAFTSELDVSARRGALHTGNRVMAVFPSNIAPQVIVAKSQRYSRVWDQKTSRWSWSTC